ncbi:hypothetical protein ACWGI9_42900 [Streptomyces sp. NPDC054833]
MLNFHGGGFVFGVISDDDRNCLDILRRVDAVVLFRRLPPRDAGRIAVHGTSAGGLAATVALPTWSGRPRPRLPVP